MSHRLPDEHGSIRGYKQHARRGDAVCDLCRAAYNQHQRELYILKDTFPAPKLVFERGEWMNDAACKGLDPGMFILRKGEPAWPAKAVCATCPVTDECLEYGLSFIDGIYGGTSYLDRRRIRQERERAVTESMSRHPSRGRGAA